MDITANCSLKRVAAFKIFEKKEYPTVNLLCIGDSMTMAETYIAHTVNKLKNINTIGLRNISHNVNHEGRGGWTCVRI